MLDHLRAGVAVNFDEETLLTTIGKSWQKQCWPAVAVSQAEGPVSKRISTTAQPVRLESASFDITSGPLNFPFSCVS